MCSRGDALYRVPRGAARTPIYTSASRGYMSPVRLLPIVLGMLAAGCVSDPVGAIQLPPAAMAHCNYIGGLHGNDGDGGIGPRAACIRYVRDTGRLPPAQ